MQLKVLGSSSAGNCYLMYNDTECLIIELGVNFKALKQTLNFNLKTIVGAIVTHEHKDHSKAVRETLLAGIYCYMSPGTAEALQIQHHRIKTISHLQRIKLGNFDVMAFNVSHDCAEPLGFLIRHPESGTTCFITDSYYCKYSFPELTNVIIEANYCPKIVQAQYESGNLHGFVKDRVIKSHMSIDTCKKFLIENDLTQVVNILLIHLSDSNSDAARFKAEVQQLTGKVVTIAEKGTNIAFGSNPF